MLAAQHAPMGAKSAPPGQSGRLAENSSAAGASQSHPLQTLITMRVRSRDQVPGTMLQLQGINPAKSDAFCSI
ncbi:hypothetical protein ACF1BQ_012865 [Bradyrhizobium sp. RDT10]